MSLGPAASGRASNQGHQLQVTRKPPLPAGCSSARPCWRLLQCLARQSQSSVHCRVTVIQQRRALFQDVQSTSGSCLCKSGVMQTLEQQLHDIA